MPEPSISETEIVNRALVRIGASRIADIGNMSDDKTANAATLYYEQRDALLRRCRWNFARKFVTLPTLSAVPLGIGVTPNPDYRGTIIYTRAYQLPRDYIRLSAVAPISAHWRIVGTALYSDAAGPITNGNLIGLQPPNADGADNVPSATNIGGAGPAGIEYIYKVADVTKFDPLFARCLALALAYELSFSVSALETLRDRVKKDAVEAFEEARAIEGMEQWPEQLYDNVVVDVRSGYSGSGSIYGW